MEKSHLNLDSQTAASYLPLHYAVSYASLEVVQYILSKRPELAMKDYKLPYNLIFLATCAGDAETLELLFQLGADPNFITQPQNNRNDLTAISQAIRSKRVECLKVLLKREAQFRNKASSDDTFVMLAIKSSQPEAVPILIDCGDDLYKISREKRETALSLACFNQYENVVKLLCSKMANIDIPHNLNAMAAVHWACRSGKPEIVRTMLAKGIDCNRLDPDGFSGPAVILGASDDEAIEIIDDLVKHGFDINLVSKTKGTLLGILIGQISKKFKVIDWLLMHGADPTATMYFGGKAQPIINYIKEKGNARMKEIFKKYCPNEFK